MAFFAATLEQDSGDRSCITANHNGSRTRSGPATLPIVHSIGGGLPSASSEHNTLLPSTDNSMAIDLPVAGLVPGFCLSGDHDFGHIHPAVLLLQTIVLEND